MGRKLVDGGNGNGTQKKLNGRRNTDFFLTEMGER
jgi:hypothetical protein